MTVRDEYEKYRKKYNLPSFDSLDKEFDLSSVENEKRVLREIRQAIRDRLEFGSNVLDTVCQPDTGSVTSMIECNFFTDSEKKKAFILSQKLMALWRTTTEAKLMNDEKTDVELIKTAYKEWPGIKDEILPFVKTMKERWKGKESIPQELGYFG